MLSLSGDNMILLFLVESGDTLDSHIIRLSGSRSKDDFFWICINQGCDLLVELAEDGGCVDISPHEPSQRPLRIPSRRRVFLNEGFRILL